MTDEPLKIVSGGQTGVDQGALAAALDRGAPCGGWCPEGRRSEDGLIPPIYPMRELSGAGYADRTLRNVQDSDGTAIVFAGTLDGGTRLTRTYCKDESKPCILIDSSTLSERDAIDALVSFVANHDIKTLNVAGPRASKWPDAHAYTRMLLMGVLARLTELTRRT